MALNFKILTLLFGIIFFMIFISAVRQKSFKTFYSTLWLLVSLFMFSLVVFEKAYKTIATLLGIRDASFLVIVSLIAFLLVYVLHLSEKVSIMSDRIQELISHNSILENEIRKIKKKNNFNDK